MMLLLLAALSRRRFSFICLFLEGDGEIKRHSLRRDVDQEKTISDLITIKEAVLVFIGTDLEQQGVEMLILF
jgi:hypothetical protein